MSNTMQWVKASERLPDGNNNYFIQFGVDGKEMWMEVGDIEYIKFLLKYHEVEWLEESASGAGMAEALEEIAKGQQGELKGEFINRIIKLAKAALERDK